MAPNQLDIAAHAIQFVCRRYDVTLADLEGPTREYEVTWPRYLAMHLIRKFTRMRLQTIGDLFDRSHAMVLCGLDSLEQTIQTDRAKKREFESVVSEFATLISPELNYQI